ncbi:MAG: hypothetical protein IPJ88_07875 [Myxococcales bacterium]|nr:MAG: hypothetical protein IPJ88_07875 [Myxococcales bacterium]
MTRLGILIAVPLFVVCTVACSSTKPSPAHPQTQHAVPAQKIIPETPVSEKKLDRSLLIAVLDAGLGRFLQGVQTKPFFSRGRFAGFQIVSIYPEDKRFSDIDPKVGDVVLRISGKRIERPEQALAVWESLRVASELRVAFLRDQKVQEVRYPIEN